MSQVLAKATTLNKATMWIVATVLFLLFSTGCENVLQKATDDNQWLMTIDEKMQQRDFDSVIKESEKYIQEYPESPAGWCTLGWAYVKTDDPDKAHECFDKSLAIDSLFDNAHVGKGVAYRSQGDNEKAKQSYLKAIEILPDNPEAYSSLLVIEMIEGNDSKAVEYGEKAWALRKDLASIPANLAIAYHYLGDNAKRDEYLKHAKRLKYPRIEVLQEIIDGKQSIR